MRSDTNLNKLQANSMWFHEFRGIIESGDAAEINGTAYLVRSVIIQPSQLYLVGAMRETP